MEDLQRVDIKLSKNTLKWAAIEAAKLDISRRQYLANLITDLKTSRTRFDDVMNMTFPAANIKFAKMNEEGDIEISDTKFSE